MAVHLKDCSFVLTVDIGVRGIGNIIITSALLGVALAMDAFSVSVANGLAEKRMDLTKASVIAGTFGVFQFIMPMAGWVMVHTAIDYLDRFERMVPWIALILLCFIGFKMIKDGIGERKSGALSEADDAEKNCDVKEHLGFGILMMQGVATSIDALSVGFTTAQYGAADALLSSLIIGAVTFAICVTGCLIGERAGNVLSWRANVVGGLILIAVGIKIFLG